MIICFINTLLDEHDSIHELSKNEMSLKAKPWLTKYIQALMKELDRGSLNIFKL